VHATNWTPTLQLGAVRHGLLDDRRRRHDDTLFVAGGLGFDRGQRAARHARHLVD